MRGAARSDSASLVARAEAEIAHLRPVISRARSTAVSVHPGAHGKARPGIGEEFWQFRRAHDGDPLRAIDWRKSARSEQHYVRDREYQSVNSVIFWVDSSASMSFTGSGARPAKIDCARLMALASAILLLRGEERVGVAGTPAVPRTGRMQIGRIAAALLAGESRDYGLPPLGGCESGARPVLLSDFLGRWDDIERQVREAAARDMTGIVIQLLDPIEAEFPFAGRVLFESSGGTLEFESLRAGTLRDAFLERLARRRSLLVELCRDVGWLFHACETGGAINPTLLWICGALEARGQAAC